jgi:hypothetical protein
LWTSSEFGTVYKISVRGQEDVGDVLDAMRASNATHIVTSDVRAQQVLDASGSFERLYRGGRFSVFRAPSVANEWASVAVPASGFVQTRFQTGQYRLDMSLDRPGDVVVKSSYHPGWRLSGGCPGRLAEDEWGLMRLKDVPAGRSEALISFRPAVWPGVISAAAWASILAGLVFGRRRRPE